MRRAASAQGTRRWPGITCPGSCRARPGAAAARGGRACGAWWRIRSAPAQRRARARRVAAQRCAEDNGPAAPSGKRAAATPSERAASAPEPPARQIPAESVLNQAGSGGAPRCALNDLFCRARARLVLGWSSGPDRSVAGNARRSAVASPAGAGRTYAGRVAAEEPRPAPLPGPRLNPEAPATPAVLPVRRARDGSTWRIGTDAEVAWIASGTSMSRAITAAIPPVFDAYTTVVLPDSDKEREQRDLAVGAAERRVGRPAVVAWLSRHRSR